LTTSVEANLGRPRADVVVHRLSASDRRVVGVDGTLRRVTTRRFLTLPDVAEVLNTTANQVYALVRSGELPAIKIGGRGQWRVEQSELEDYIARMYEQTRQFVADHPFGATEASDLAGTPDDLTTG
jgi:excisionase family DNA binding protein